MRKKAYLELDEPESDRWFTYMLAERLRKTVGEILEMPNEEFVGWHVYFGRKAQEAELAKGSTWRP